jgi:hypothetical protein
MKHLGTLMLFFFLILDSCRYVEPQKANFVVSQSYEDVMRIAKINNKPILIVFMTKNYSYDALSALKLPEISAIIDSNFNVVKLEVDKANLLPTDQDFYNRNGHKITTIGQFNSDIQKRLIPEFIIPMYVLLDKNGNLMKVGKHALYQAYVSPDNKKEVHLFKSMLTAGIKLSN